MRRGGDSSLHGRGGFHIRPWAFTLLRTARGVGDAAPYNNAEMTMTI